MSSINSFAIDSNTEVMPTINEHDDSILQVIDDQLHNVENIIVDDDNNDEHADKRQRIDNNDINIDHFNDNTEVYHESPNENTTSTTENNPVQEGVTLSSSSSSSNATYEKMYRMSYREYYNKK